MINGQFWLEQLYAYFQFLTQNTKMRNILLLMEHRAKTYVNLLMNFIFLYFCINIKNDNCILAIIFSTVWYLLSKGFLWTPFSTGIISRKISEKEQTILNVHVYSNTLSFILLMFLFLYLFYFIHDKLPWVFPKLSLAIFYYFMFLETIDISLSPFSGQYFDHNPRNRTSLFR